MANHNILLVVRDAGLKQQLLSELVLRRPGPRAGTRRGHYQVSICGTIDEALQRFAGKATSAVPAVIVVDHSAFCSDLHTEWPHLRTLVEKAPAVLLLDPSRLPSMNGLAEMLRGGRLEVVLRDGRDPAVSLPLVIALVERHTAGEPLASASDQGRSEAWQSFGEILRHELNNPLTGILGNAELLLAHRDRLPPTDVERLKTIADMAVRLRETVRRLGNAWENCGWQSDVSEEVEK